jgi:hypothetical protein
LQVSHPSGPCSVDYILDKIEQDSVLDQERPTALGIDSALQFGDCFDPVDLPVEWTIGWDQPALAATNADLLLRLKAGVFAISKGGDTVMTYVDPHLALGTPGRHMNDGSRNPSRKQACGEGLG